MDHFKSRQFQAWRASDPARSRALYVLIGATMVTLSLFGCNRTGEDPGTYPITYQTDGLPNLNLTDQYGHRVSLASLKGKRALFDFIYTSCPGPCQLETQHMKLIADKLGPTLGSKVLLVSVTIDPEHDRPSRLFSYAQSFEANVNGWYFLTGSPSQIDQLLSGFRLARKRESDGEVDHILGYFLVGPDGHPTVEYSQWVKPSIAARDAEETATRNTLVGRLSFALRHLI